MRQSSSRSDGLLGPLFASPDVERELDDAALLRAMLDVEVALARAEADAGIVPAGAADAIAAAARDTQFDLTKLGVDAQAAGNPVVPLVRRLVAAVPQEARPWVHHGTTSQDVVDTALMLLAKRAGAVLVVESSGAAEACAALAERHRETVMVARTLGQHAGLTTFGLKAAGWLVALDESGRRLRAALEADAAVQLGGAAGTLGVLGGDGPRVVSRLAELLDLAEPPLPWHTDRQRVLAIAAAAAGLVAATGKVALDVELLAQTEVGEVSEGGGQGHGGSSALPHKHNPVDAVLVRSAAFRAPGLVSTLFASAQHEHERAAGAWHGEWETFRQLLSLAGGAASRTKALVCGLVVHPDRMRETVDASAGLVMAESLAARLAPLLGRAGAHDVVARLARDVVERGHSLRQAAISDADVRAHLSSSDIDEALDPRAALRAVGPLIDRALRGRRP